MLVIAKVPPLVCPIIPLIYLDFPLCYLVMNDFHHIRNPPFLLKLSLGHQQTSGNKTYPIRETPHQQILTIPSPGTLHIKLFWNTITLLIGEMRYQIVYPDSSHGFTGSKSSGTLAEDSGPR